MFEGVDGSSRSVWFLYVSIWRFVMTDAGVLLEVIVSYWSFPGSRYDLDGFEK